MSKRRKKKGAERLEAQARAHAILYGLDWHEVSDYKMMPKKARDFNPEMNWDEIQQK